MNALERMIATVAPKAALKRAQARMALGLVREYEGAARGRRTDGWRTRSTSANSETRKALPLLRDRARDLVRNNPYAARGVSVIASNLVGYGIKTAFQTPNKKALKALQSAWLAWAESTQCDADGQHDIYGLQELVARGVVESGEMLVRRRWRRASDGLTVPLQLQVLEADFIDTAREGTLQNGNIIIQGIELDKLGRRVAYYLFDEHPGDGWSFSRGTFVSHRVPAEDILHVYRMDRAGQLRGVSWLSPVIIRLRDFDEYEDAQLVRQKIAACFTAFVYDSETPEATGSGSKPQDLIERLEPAAIEFLPPGKQITLANPPGVQGYSEYTSVTLHAIAAGLGVPYESLTGDYSQVNFTSGRMGRAEFHALLDVWQWKMFVPRFCGGVSGWFVEAAMLAGLPAQGATAKHTPPRRVLVDPTREIPAIIKAIRAGLQSMPNGIREMGIEPETMLDEIEEWNKEIDRRGIILDTDPRRVTNGGQAQITPESKSVEDATGGDDAGGESKESA
ncbi:portal protein [Bordetella phage PY223]